MKAKKPVDATCRDCKETFKRYLSGRGRNLCYNCHGNHIREGRARAKALRIANGIPGKYDKWHPEPLSYIAHRAVALAISHGVLPSPKTLPCADCGGAATEYDHRDYNRPLMVEPVCRGCNRRRGSAVPMVLPLFALIQQDKTA